MSRLELKIPPPVIALLCVALAWIVAFFTPGFAFALPARLLITALLVLGGFSLDVYGLIAFRRAKTTLDPRAPDKSTAIVRSGPYRFSRNPMYLGLSVVLLGVCAYLANPLTIVAIIAFIAYMTRFQIIPEERLLLSRFGETYAQYTRSVRRWL